MTLLFLSGKKNSFLYFRLCVIFLLYVLVIHSIQGQAGAVTANSGYTISKRFLSIENGLASHEVFCGLQDDAGFIWFGTRNGLNRYDGKACLLFTRQRNRLQDNKVVQLAKDNANNLFIEYGSTGFQLTTNGKVDVMDAVTHNVKTLTAAFPNLPFKEQDVYWIANDGTDEVRFLTAHPFQLWTYTSKHGFRLNFEMKGWNGSDQAVDYRTTGPFCSFSPGKALLKLTNQHTQYLTTKTKTIAFQQRNVLRSLPVGFTTQNELLITYNTSSNSDAFTIDKLTASGDLSPITDLKKYCLNSVKGNYWYQVCMATNGASSLFYNSQQALYYWSEQAFLKVIDKSEWKGFENLFIYRLFSDSLGNQWVCTSHGVLQLTIKKNRFSTYFSSSQQTIQPNSQARGIYADQKGKVVANVWMHTFLQQGRHLQAVPHDEIHYALINHQNTLYSGGYSLFRYEDSTNKVTSYAGGLGSEIWAMFSMNDSLLLLGRTTGCAFFNVNTNRFDSIARANRLTPEAHFVYRFFRDKAGIIWAVAENGLYKLITQNNPSAKVGHRLKLAKIQSSFLSGLSLFDAYQQPDGVFWLATNGEGLYRWNPKTNEVRQFNITAGLPSDVLYRIEPDDFGNLWISSDYGLIRFNRNNFLVTTYTTLDGISHNEFNRISSFRDTTGKLYFGGLNGVNAFNPRDFKSDTNTLQIPLRIIDFSQFVGSRNELVNKTTELLTNARIILEPADKFFTLNFQLLDFTSNEGHRYAYRIDGIDENWNYLNENMIRISGLPYGSFKVRIKAQNREGVWSKSQLVVPLMVLRPFYFQWWFMLVVIVLFLLAIYLLIQFRLQQLAHVNKKLEETVNERTILLKQSLSEQSSLLLEKDILMKEIHHRVKNNLQVISGLLELQSKGLQDETARGALQEGQNRVRSIALIHQNLYQFENLSTIDLKRFVGDLCKQIQSVFQKQKPITITSSVPDVHLDIDSAVPLGLVLNELVSNSFKYAFTNVASGEINLTIRSIAEGKYQLVYSDNGPGLPIDFDLTKATTLGLQLVNDLSRQIGGKVLYSKDTATFTINFSNRNVRKNED